MATLDDVFRTYCDLRAAKAEKAAQVKDLTKELAEAHDHLLEVMKSSGVSSMDLGDGKVLRIEEKLKEAKATPPARDST